MHQVLLALINVGVFSFVVTFLGYFFLGNKFANRLKAQYRSIWLELGSPDLLNRVSDKSKFSVYLGKQRYLSLGDESLIRLGNSARAMLLIWVISIVVLLIDGFTLIFLDGSGG